MNERREFELILKKVLNMFKFEKIKKLSLKNIILISFLIGILVGLFLFYLVGKANFYFYNKFLNENDVLFVVKDEEEINTFNLFSYSYKDKEKKFISSINADNFSESFGFYENKVFFVNSDEEIESLDLKTREKQIWADNELDDISFKVSNQVIKIGEISDFIIKDDTIFYFKEIEVNNRKSYKLVYRKIPNYPNNITLIDNFENIDKIGGFNSLYFNKNNLSKKSLEIFNDNVTAGIGQEKFYKIGIKKGDLIETGFVNKEDLKKENNWFCENFSVAEVQQIIEKEHFGEELYFVGCKNNK